MSNENIQQIMEHLNDVVNGWTRTESSWYREADEETTYFVTQNEDSFILSLRDNATNNVLEGSEPIVITELSMLPEIATKEIVMELDSIFKVENTESTLHTTDVEETEEA